MTSSEDLQQRYAASLMNTFGPPEARARPRRGRPTSGTPTGNRYLDLLGGIAVNALGHAHPALVEAVTDQLRTLGHVSNFFATEPQVALAEKLLALLGLPAGGGKVFFTNSGAEANEAAFKLTRRTGRTHLVAMEGSFHGRTMGALALTSKAAYREPFEPLPGRRHLRARTATPTRSPRRSPTRPPPSSLEPIQGEAGVVVPAGRLPRRGPRDHHASTARCCGSTRCRPAWAAPAPGSRTRRSRASPPTWSRWPRAWPAASRSARCVALGRGRHAARPGNHGTTFGGNPVAAAAALAVHRHDREGRPARQRHQGRRAAPRRRWPTRGSPRSAAAGCSSASTWTPRWPPRVAEAALAAGVILNACTPDRIRLAPPLVLTADQAQRVPRRLADDPRRGLRERSGTAMTRHFLRDDDLTPAEQAEVLALAKALKADPARAPARSRGRSAVAVIFDKPTLRTQASFTAGIAELGGYPMLVDGSLAQIGIRESIADTARVLGRQVVGDRVADLRPGRGSRRWPRTPACRSSTRSPTSSTPASCSPTCRPSRSTRARLAGLTVAFLGDAASQHVALLPARRRHRRDARAGQRPRRLHARPRPCWPGPSEIAGTTGGSAHYVADPVEAVTGADVVVTDTWVSMGKEAEADERERAVPALRARRRPARRTPGPTRSCCTACRPTAARRSRPRCIDGPQQRGVGRGREPAARPEGAARLAAGAPSRMTGRASR